MPGKSDQYDLIVIGGGINGAGIARDAALRGMRVLLLEKQDFGSGTSSWSSRLIHGGLRYLEYGEVPLVFESLHERRRLREVAPHLVRRLQLTIPVYRDARRGMFLVRLGMIAYDLLSIGKRIPRHQMLDASELIAAEPGLNRQGLLGGARYYDAQVTYAERLVMENILAASEAGATVRNYSPVVAVRMRQGAAHRVRYHCVENGSEVDTSARAIINAAGPWVDQVLATVNGKFAPEMGGTKGSHIIVGRFDGAPDSAFYVEAQADGRPFFIIPWNDQYLIGTTDIRFNGDPADAMASDREIDYLLEETNRIFPGGQLTRDQIHYAYAGVRPLPRREKGPESAITRKHIIRQYKGQSEGLISIIGGKLTTYRNLAEQAVDTIQRQLGGPGQRCQTREKLLPGAADVSDIRRQLAEFAFISAECGERLSGIYGKRAIDIAKLAQSRPALSQSLKSDPSILAAEVYFVIQTEFARSLIDIVHRRLMTGLSADQGKRSAPELANLAADAAGWSESESRRQLSALENYNLKLNPDRRET